MSIGTEILLGQIVDTNAALVGELFAELGIVHTHRQTVGDNLDRMVDALRVAMKRSEIVLTIGGLGPTQDDLTRQAIATATDDKLVLDAKIADGLKTMFRERGVEFTAKQESQALRPSRSIPIHNSNGTAPGLICEHGANAIVALPGPKNEFERMLRGPVREYLLTKLGQAVIHSRIVRVVGIPEAEIDERCSDLINAEDPTVAPYAKTGEVHLRVTSRGATALEADARIAPVIRELQTRLGHSAYALDDTTFPAQILRMLRERGETLAVVESCTGGGLGSSFTSVAGSSDVFVGGLITYSNEAKFKLAGVAPQMVQAHGAVSQECATAMAIGGKAALNADWCISITGIAGPAGGTPEKPVGTVYVAVASPAKTWVKRFKFRGGREDVRNRAIVAAQLLTYEAILEQ